MRKRATSRALVASMAGLLALVAGGCSSSGGGGEDVGKASKVSFDERNAGGVEGWAGLAVIGGGSSNKLFITDARSHNVVTAITPEGAFNERTDPTKYPNLRDAHAIVFTKDFKRMFTAVAFEYAVSTIIEYDPITLREVARVNAGKGSHHLALSPDDKFLYVANQYDANLSVIDTGNMKKVKDVPVGDGPDYITPSMYWDGKAINSPYLFITVDKATPPAVAVLDWRTNTIVKRIPMPAAAHGVNLTPDGKQVWLAGIGFKEVWVIDVATLAVTKKLPIEEPPIHISISPDSAFAYITTANNLIFKVDTKTYEAKWRSEGTVIPAHTGLSPDGKELWTLNHGMDVERYPFLLGGEPVQGVQVWDTDNGELVNEIPMEAMPHEIQFVPYSAFGTPKPEQDVAVLENKKDDKK